MSAYRVSDTAPPVVCGRRVRPGDPLALTAAETQYERDLGHVVEVDDVALRMGEATGEPRTGIAIEPDGGGVLATSAAAE